MRLGSSILAGSIVCVLGAQAPLVGQEGHPMVGSWHGEWETPDGPPMSLTLVIDWDGTTLTGLVNPVTDRAPLENARLDSADWTVHFEARVRDASGTARPCVADGALDKLGSDQRELDGSWTCGDLQARFHLVRDRDY